MRTTRDDPIEIKINIAGDVCTEAGADAAALRQKLVEIEVLARGLQFDESGEPKTERVLKRLAGLDMSSGSELLAATSHHR